MTRPHAFSHSVPSVLSAPSASSPRSHFERSFRNVLRRFIVLAGGLLMLLLPGLALADEYMSEGDDDPFDRPGFYVGLGGSYQYNVFQDRIEDVISDALEVTVVTQYRTVQRKQRHLLRR